MSKDPKPFKSVEDIKSCLNCGKTLNNPRNTKYCNQKCYIEYMGKRSQKKVILNTCPACGKKFETKYKKGKFCSKSCSSSVAGNTKKKVKKKCVQCGEEFTVPPSREKTAKYCSVLCRNRATAVPRKTGYSGKCPTCGKEVYKAKSLIGDNQKEVYCSMKCKGLGKRKRKIVQCLVCGESFETKLSEINRGGGKYCSNECVGKANSVNFKGPGHPNWMGGLSFEPYCYKFDEEFKERVRIFWDRKCGLCGKTEKANKKKLSVHHVTYDKEVCCNTSKPLFVALCGSCHQKTNFKREYWMRMLSEYIALWFDGDSFIERQIGEAIDGDIIPDELDKATET